MPAVEGLVIQCPPVPWKVALEPIFMVSAVPVAAQVHWAVDVGEVKRSTRFSASIFTPQEVPVFRQFVLVVPLKTLKEVALPPTVRSISLQVNVERMKSGGRAMEKLLEALMPP